MAAPLVACLRLVAVCALIALSAPARAADPSDCSAPAFAGNAHLDPAFMCVEMSRQTVTPQNQETIIRTVRDKRSDQQIVGQYADEAVAAVTEALYAYGNMGRELRFANVTIVAMDPNIPGRMRPGQKQEEFGTVRADAQSWSMPNECVIRLYIREVDNTTHEDVLGGMRSAMAHEAFHCIQQWTYPKQTSSAQYVGGASWWVEGIATAISGLVVDNGPLVASLSQQFVKEIVKRPLTSFTLNDAYKPVYFFSWLYHQRKYALFDFMAAMPTVPGEAAQRDALGMLADFDKFAQEAIDGTIKDVRGNPLADANTTDIDVFTESRSQGMFMEPFQLFARSIRFEEGMYLAYLEGPHSASFRKGLGKKAGPASPWEGGIMDASTGCETKIFVVAGMWTRKDRAQFVLKAEKLPGTCVKCEPEPEMDQCLVGEWRMDNGSLAEALRLQQEDDLVQVIVGGGAGVRFGKDGKNLLGFDTFSVEGVVTGDGKVRFRIYLAGGITSAWSAKNGQLKMCYRDSDALIEIVASGGGSSGPMEFSTLPMSNMFNASYTCSGNEMMLTQKIEGAGDLTIRFNRFQGVTQKP